MQRENKNSIGVEPSSFGLSRGGGQGRLEHNLPDPKVEPGEALWRIGGQCCEIPLGNEDGEIALLIKRGPRLFVRNAQSRHEVWVNDEQLARNTEVELTRYDALHVAGTALVIGSRYFLENSGLAVATSALEYSQGAESQKRVLCHGLYLRAEPGTLTGIIGPVGCGKTVLLDLISGEKMPTSGRVQVGPSFDLHRDKAALTGVIGCVPQEDLMNPELTVGDALECRLRLRFPDMTARVRQQWIADACQQVGLDKQRLPVFLGTVIGDGVSCRGSSGGERKLANIVLELLCRPRVLILDEPTSGLSSVDAEKIIRLLRHLASQQGITVITTVHQPSRTAFASFDQVLAIAPEGRMAYYGPATFAKEYFENVSEQPCPPEANPSDFILSLLAQEDEADRLTLAYRLRPVVQPLPESAEPERSGSARAVLVTPSGTGHFTSKFCTLTRRNLRILWGDRPTLRLSFGQVPLIALVILMAFVGFESDDAGFETLAHRIHFIVSKADKLRSRKQPVRIDELIKRSENGEGQNGNQLTWAAARQRGAIYFALAAASVWCGILGGCREIVTERHILRRERRTGLALAPYLGSKMLVQSGQTAIQTGLLVLLVAPLLLAPSTSAWIGLWAMLWLTAIVSTSLGLLISCCAPSLRFALTAVPLLMIPQMILGGVLRTEVGLAKAAVLPRVASWLTVQRWGFEGCLNRDAYSHGRVMMPVFRGEDGSPYGPLDWIQFRESTLRDCFFLTRTAFWNELLPVACLGAAAVMFLGLAYYQLARPLARHQNERRCRLMNIGFAQNWKLF